MTDSPGYPPNNMGGNPQQNNQQNPPPQQQRQPYRESGPSTHELSSDLSSQRNRSIGGLAALILLGVLLILVIGSFVIHPGLGSLLTVLVFFVSVFILSGMYILQPNQAAVFTLFGSYRGSDSTSGLRMVNPFYRKRKVSLRINNFTTQTSKVNDANGNPIEIAAVVVWRVVDPGRAIFGINSYLNYVHTQSESAVRQLARAYPYDSFEDINVVTLIGDTTDVNEHLKHELQERCDDAGVEILEARITDLSYAPEIAEAMLRRQQASAIVAARAKIVEGAVLMVREAVDSLEDPKQNKSSIQFDPAMKAKFASNLMTVIVSDAPTNPVVNVGNQ